MTVDFTIRNIIIIIIHTHIDFFGFFIWIDTNPINVTKKGYFIIITQSIVNEMKLHI